MSESYTVGGDAYYKLIKGKVAGQTFRPVQDHVLEWIDLEIKNWTVTPKPWIDIHYADANHEPHGPWLSQSISWSPNFKWPGGTSRARFKMRPFTLTAGEYYAMLIRSSPILPDIQPEWQFDQGDATYPRGIRISREAPGDPWTKYYGDDHMFAEFGVPPSFTPPPEPPITNGLITSLKYLRTDTGYHIVVTTNVPAHLFCEITTIPPRKHTSPLYRRGIAIQSKLRYCFVAYHENEQIEPGDTLYHTFIKEPWPDCETRYFLFRFKVDGEWLKSESPIFTRHRQAPQEIQPVATLSNRTVRQTDVTWSDAHDAPSGTIMDNYDDPWYMIFAGTELTVSFWIYRGFLMFDTSLIPQNMRVVKAHLMIYVFNKYANYLPYTKIQVTKGNQSDPIIPTDYGAQLGVNEILGEANILDMTAGQYNSIPLNHFGLNFINPTGITRLCLRGEMDVKDIPSIAVYANYISFYSAQKGDGFQPRLIIQLEPK